MAEGRVIQRVDEAIVLRSWPFQEADLLISLFTREQGRVKGVARYAMRSRRRFGGALEPMTHVRASYTERPKQDLVRMDSFEIIQSPLSEAMDWERAATLQLMAEIVEEALPEQAREDAVFRLVAATLPQVRVGSVVLPMVYFCFWMSRLMGWMPTLAHCSVCGLDLRGRTAWWSATLDGVVCEDDRRDGGLPLDAEMIGTIQRAFQQPVQEFVARLLPRPRAMRVLRFGVSMLERHLQRRLRSAAALERL